MKTVYFIIVLLIFFTEAKSQTVNNKAKQNRQFEKSLTAVNAINFYYVPDSSIKSNKVPFPEFLGLFYCPHIIKKTGKPIFNSLYGAVNLNYDTLTKTISIIDLRKKVEEIFEIEIYNDLNRTVFSETIDNASTFALHTLSNGLYLYKIFNNINLVGYGKIQILK